VVLVGLLAWMAGRASPTTEPPPPPGPAAPGPASPSPSTTTVPAAWQPRPVTSPAPLDAAALFERASPAVVSIEVVNEEFKKVSQGSGFLVSHDGMIVTNHHVIHRGLRGLVRFQDRKTFPVSAVLAEAPEKDLAVIQIDVERMPYLELLPRGEKPKVGARAFAIGTPVGLTNTLSEGLVSGLREQNGREVIQTTAAISSGSSGGPLLDDRARVIGVNTYIQVRREGPAIVENINFAVASDEVHEVLNAAFAARTRQDGSRGALEPAAAAELGRIYSLIGQKQWLDASGAVKTLAQRYPDNPQIRLLQARIAMRMNFLDEAIAAYEALVRLAPDLAEGHLGLGLARSKKQEWEAAAEALERAVALAPDDPIAQRALGRALLEAGRKDPALKALKEAVRLDDDDPEAWFHLGRAYLEQELYDPAEDAFIHTLRLKPDKAMAHAYLAMAALRQGRVQEALKAAVVAARMRPDLGYPLYVFALALHKAGQKEVFEKAKAQLEKTDPDLAEKLIEEIGTEPGETAPPPAEGQPPKGQEAPLAPPQPPAAPDQGPAITPFRPQEDGK